MTSLYGYVTVIFVTLEVICHIDLVAAKCRPRLFISQKPLPVHSDILVQVDCTTRCPTKWPPRLAWTSDENGENERVDSNYTSVSTLQLSVRPFDGQNDKLYHCQTDGLSLSVAISANGTVRCLDSSYQSSHYRMKRVAVSESNTTSTPNITRNISDVTADVTVSNTTIRPLVTPIYPIITPIDSVPLGASHAGIPDIPVMTYSVGNTAVIDETTEPDDNVDATTNDITTAKLPEIAATYELVTYTTSAADQASKPAVDEYDYSIEMLTAEDTEYNDTEPISVNKTAEPDNSTTTENAVLSSSSTSFNTRSSSMTSTLSSTTAGGMASSITSSTTTESSPEISTIGTTPSVTEVLTTDNRTSEPTTISMTTTDSHTVTSESSPEISTIGTTPSVTKVLTTDNRTPEPTTVSMTTTDSHTVTSESSPEISTIGTTPSVTEVLTTDNRTPEPTTVSMTTTDSHTVTSESSPEISTIGTTPSVTEVLTTDNRTPEPTTVSMTTTDSHTVTSGTTPSVTEVLTTDNRTPEPTTVSMTTTDSHTVTSVTTRTTDQPTTASQTTPSLTTTKQPVTTTETTKDTMKTTPDTRTGATDLNQSEFGRNGIIYFAVAVGVAGLLLFLTIILTAMLCCQPRKRGSELPGGDKHAPKLQMLETRDSTSEAYNVEGGASVTESIDYERHVQENIKKHKRTTKLPAGASSTPLAGVSSFMVGKRQRERSNSTTPPKSPPPISSAEMKPLIRGEDEDTFVFNFAKKPGEATGDRHSGIVDGSDRRRSNASYGKSRHGSNIPRDSYITDV